MLIQEHSQIVKSGILTSGGVQEFLKNRAAEGLDHVAFDMPLNGQQEGILRSFDYLDEAVFGPADGDELLAETVDPLLMATGDGDFFDPEPIVDLTFRFEGNGMLGRMLLVPVIDLVVDVGQILMQTAAVSDIDYLDSQADSHHRQAMLLHLLIQQ